jgi:hypothetical protein
VRTLFPETFLRSGSQSVRMIERYVDYTKPKCGRECGHTDELCLHLRMSQTSIYYSLCHSRYVRQTRSRLPAGTFSLGLGIYL